MESTQLELQSRTKITDQLFSRTFCFAKWYHSNIYLHLGETHSCYHPAPHRINESEIKTNPTALHNTIEKKSERKMMIDGKQPPGCQYCWNIENIDANLVSDRHIRNGSLYSENRIAEVKRNGWEFDVVPNYLELSFSNQCQMKCGYCHPKASSRYYNEIKQHGPYSQVKNHRCDVDWFEVYNEENNPFISAFWRWWPELQKNLRILRITGGEPLIQQSTTDLLNMIEKAPIPELELNINSNMAMRPSIFIGHIELIQEIAHKKLIRGFKLFTSIDTWGPQAEYIRTGLDLNIFEENMRYYLERVRSYLNFSEERLVISI